MISLIDTRSRHGTPIEWTHLPGYTGETWNPVAGCELASPGCTNCYAMPMAWRHKLMMEASTGNPAASPYYGTTKVVNGKPVWTGVINTVESALEKPLRWKKPRAIFVNSMSDLFHPKVPFEFIDRVFAVAALCPQHIFIILTKRPDQMRKYIADVSAAGPGRGTVTRIADVIQTISPSELRSRWPLPNVWLGTSTEDQKRADERLPHLIATPAAVRLVSAEPLLEPIDFGDHLYRHQCHDCFNGRTRATGHFFDEPCPACGGTGCEKQRIDWIIAGGESGRGARPMHPKWVRSIRDQCAVAGVPFFFKQWGEYEPHELVADDRPEPWRRSPRGSESWAFDELSTPRAALLPVNFARVGKGCSGRLLDGIEHNDFPTMRMAA